MHLLECLQESVFLWFRMLMCFNGNSSSGNLTVKSQAGIPSYVDYFIAVPWKTAVPPGLCVLQEYPLIPACFQFPCLRGQRTIYDFPESSSLGTGSAWPSSSDRFWPRSSLALWLRSLIIGVSRHKEVKRDLTFVNGSLMCPPWLHCVWTTVKFMCTDLYVLWLRACLEVVLCLWLIVLLSMKQWLNISLHTHALHWKYLLVMGKYIISRSHILRPQTPLFVYCSNCTSNISI